MPLIVQEFKVYQDPLPQTEVRDGVRNPNNTAIKYIFRSLHEISLLIILIIYMISISIITVEIKCHVPVENA